jgi:hypothetical protein|tara:strand:+ start:2253 stop:2546 length:294 start_codon:yes stop_codon:yes gene_type:complete
LIIIFLSFVLALLVNPHQFEVETLRSGVEPQIDGIQRPAFPAFILFCLLSMLATFALEKVAGNSALPIVCGILGLLVLINGIKSLLIHRTYNQLKLK